VSLAPVDVRPGGFLEALLAEQLEGALLAWEF